MAVAALALTGVILLFSGVLPFQAFIITSDSMGNRGSVVIVHKDHFHQHQAVTFKGPHGETVTHNLIGFRSDGTAVTKGSMNKTADPGHAPRSAIIGGVVMTIPVIGGIILFFGTPIGLGILGLIMIAAVLCAALGRPKPQATSTEATPDRDPAIPTAS